jgi:hypothetical protein
LLVESGYSSVLLVVPALPGLGEDELQGSSRLPFKSLVKGVALMNRLTID